MRGHLSTLLLMLEAGTAGISCQPATREEDLGTTLGTFEGSALLTTEDCGPALDAPKTYPLEVELVRGDAAIYWIQGNSMLMGSHDDIKAQWSSRQTSAVDTNCTLERRDSLEGQFDDASSPSRMRGTITYTFDGLTGSNCSRQPVVGGGSFDKLPCSVVYGYVVERD